MASRRAIREAFYAELETAASGFVPTSNITQEEPNSDEDLPAIVHDDNYRQVPMNRSAAPTDVTYSNGVVQSITYSRMMQAQFSVTIISDDEQEKEDIYEAVRTYFEPYSTPIKDASSLQTDAHRVEVNDATSRDDPDREPTSRGDSLSINIGFERKYTISRSGGDFGTMDTIEHDIDVDGDGTADIENTTT